MLARRVIAISPDKAFAKRLKVGLQAAGGTVETYSSLDAMARGEIQAALVVVHLDGPLRGALDELASRLRKGAWVIAVLPKSNLVDTVSTLRVSGRVAGVLIADDMHERHLSAMATRVLFGDIFGLEKVMPWGTQVHSLLIGDYQEKSVCIARVSEFAELMGVRRKYRESIEQVLDEMLMNALYDAPVDADGKQLFADIPTKSRISLRMEQKAVVQYSCDGSMFTLSVRDSFGTLNRDTVLKYLHKCLHSEQQIDRKTGGAGLGLYIIANATTSFIFNVLPGVATEVVCTFDLHAPKVQLKNIGFFNEKIDPSGRLVGGPSKLIPAGAGYPVERREAGAPPPSKGVMLALGSAIVLLLALIGLVAYPRFVSSPTGSVEITSTPLGASIEVEDADRGVTSERPLRIDDLDPDRTYKITATKDGWQPATRFIKPGKDKAATVNFPLKPLSATVRVESAPQSAEVFVDGIKLGTTPFNVDTLPTGKDVELEFRKQGYQVSKRTLRVPGPGGQAMLSHSLPIDPNWGSVKLLSVPEGARIYHNGNLQADTTPIEEFLVPSESRQMFTFKLDGYQPALMPVTVKAGQRGIPLSVILEKGGGVSITSPQQDALRQATVSVERQRKCHRKSLPMLDCPLENGSYKVRIESPRPYMRIKLKVVIAGNHLTRAISIGFVRSEPGYKIYIGKSRDGTPRYTTKAAYKEGTVTVSAVKDGFDNIVRHRVRIQAGQTITVP